MNIITIDFETYYDQHYSLSKITTEEYVRHELFEVVGVAVKVNDEETQWFSGTKAQTKRWLGQFDWDNSIAVAHNAMFDMSIMSWIFGIRPKRIADTLAMGRGLHGMEVSVSLKAMAEYYGMGEKGDEVIRALGKGRLDFTDEELARYGQYCVNDVQLTYELFKQMAPVYPVTELRLIDLTVRMFTEPVLQLDKDILTAHLTDVKAAKDELMSRLSVDRDILMSNPKLADLLMSNGVYPPMKTSPTTGKRTYAFAKNDEAFKALLDHDDINIQSIVAARLGVKSTLEETRTERFLSAAERGAFPIPLRYYGAHTGRWSGEDKVNMQNLPRKSPLKDAVIAPEGHVIIDCDSSQIEARTLAWLAGQDDLVQFFEENNREIAAGVAKDAMQYDPYKIMASTIYDVPVLQVNNDQRFVGKTTILGAGYGMGAERFQQQLAGFDVRLELDDCRYIIATYRQSYSKIPELWEAANRVLTAMMQTKTARLGIPDVLQVDLFGIRLPNGMYVRYPNLRSVTANGKEELIYDTRRGRSTMTTRIYGGKVVENVCQALARIIIGEQMLRIAKRYKVGMTVHDSVVVIAPEKEAEEARSFVEGCMRMPPKWAAGLPLNCESKIGASYGG